MRPRAIPLLAFLVGCRSVDAPTITVQTKPDGGAVGAPTAIVDFASLSEMRDALDAPAASAPTPGHGDVGNEDVHALFEGSRRLRVDASVQNGGPRGVDEGDVVKVAGDYLVLLRRGRLFTVRIAGDALAPVSHVDASAPGLNSGVWYDDLFVSKSRVIVIGYSYVRFAAEVGLFDIDATGQLTHRSTVQFRGTGFDSARDFASRLVGDRLVLYLPAPAPRGDPAFDQRSLPSFRTLRNDEDTPFSPLLAPTRIGKPLETTPRISLHTVVACNVSAATLACDARGVFGPRRSIFHVASDAVYVWGNADTERPESQIDSFKESPPRALLYRLPLDGSQPTATRVAGEPSDSSSFHVADGHVDVLLHAAARPRPIESERHRTRVALLRLPITSFGREFVAPRSAYTELPGVRGATLQNRFIGDQVVYTVPSGWQTTDRRERVVFTYDYASRDVSKVHAVAIDHEVMRIEPMGTDAIVLGSRESDFAATAVKLGSAPEARGVYTRPTDSYFAALSHPFVQRSAEARTGLFGIPLRTKAGLEDPLRPESATIVYVASDQLALRELGAVDARKGPYEDRCRSSCEAWYGTTRPIILGDRVLSFIGYELVESVLEGRTLREKRRVDLLPGPTPSKR